MSDLIYLDHHGDDHWQHGHGEPEDVEEGDGDESSLRVEDVCHRVRQDVRGESHQRDEVRRRRPNERSPRGQVSTKSKHQQPYFWFDVGQTRFLIAYYKLLTHHTTLTHF